MEFKTNFVVFDTETSGLSSEKHGLMEIAMIAFNSKLEQIGTYDSLIKPYGNYEVNPFALEHNGLTMDQIEKSGKDSKIVAKEISDFFTKVKVPGRGGKPIVCGHNVDKFDIPFLDTFMDFNKKDLSKLINIDFTIDTMWWARIMWQESENYKLGTSCRNAGIELIDAHRAMNDTKVTAELVKFFLKNLRGIGNVGQEVKSEDKGSPREKHNFDY